VSGSASFLRIGTTPRTANLQLAPQPFSLRTELTYLPYDGFAFLFSAEALFREWNEPNRRIRMAALFEPFTRSL
jgi:hypothetical protein